MSSDVIVHETKRDPNGTLVRVVMIVGGKEGYFVPDSQLWFQTDSGERPHENLIKRARRQAAAIFGKEYRHVFKKDVVKK